MSKAPYEYRFAQAVKRLPKCMDDLDAKYCPRIPDLVNLVALEVAMYGRENCCIASEEDLLDCRRFINAYEEAD